MTNFFIVTLVTDDCGFVFLITPYHATVCYGKTPKRVNIEVFKHENF